MASMRTYEKVVREVLASNARSSCRIRLYDGRAGAAAYLTKELNDSELKGWTETGVEFNTAAKMMADAGRRVSCFGVLSGLISG
jgi:hypothetical protein